MSPLRRISNRSALWLTVVLIVGVVALRLTGFRATAQCQDGTYTWSGHHRGTCSGHRGVRRWLRYIPR